MNWHSTKRVVGQVLLGSVLAARAFAGDWYVDALNGVDNNNGVTPGTAWRSISHALTLIPGGGSVETIHIASGLYSHSSSGDSFPLVLRPNFQLIGEEGPANTVVDAGGATAITATNFSYTTGFGPNTRIEGLWLRNAAQALDLQDSFGMLSLSLVDLWITNVAETGIRIQAILGAISASAQVNVIAEDVVIDGCGKGVECGAGAGKAGHVGFAASFHRCRITHCGVGMKLWSYAFFYTAPVYVVLDRCWIGQTAGDGILVDHVGGPTHEVYCTAESSSIVGNGGAGFRAADPGNAHIARIEFESCTIGGNAHQGIVLMPGQITSGSRLRNCILHGNQDDLLTNSPIQASYDLIGDGDYAGTNGNIAADPLFFDPTRGEYRVRWGSPAIDAGDPALAGSLDLVGTARSIDGNLDLQVAPDIGAFEFEPLHRRGTPRPGARIGLELWGVSGASTTLFVSPSNLTGPQSTPFGQLFLDPTTSVMLATQSIPSNSILLVRRFLPSDASLIGTSLSFQALTSSALASSGSAYTNPISFVIQP